jgi:hypothetical protein
MKFIKQDDVNELCIELEVIVGKKFSSSQFDRLAEGFKKIDWIKACQLVRDFERQERFPSNVYGVLANRIEEQIREQTQAVYTRQKWVVSANDRVSSDEAHLWFEIIEEAKIWIALKIDHYRNEFAHIRDLPPPGQKCHSWSGIVDYAINTWMDFDSRIKNSTPEQRVELLKNILENCKNERIKKTEAKTEAA